jgi:hypothetical protein
MKDPHTRQQLRLGNERTTSMIYRKAIRVEIVKRALGISSVFWKTRKWFLRRGRPPPLKRKKKLQIQEEPVMWEHQPLHEL